MPAGTSRCRSTERITHLGTVNVDYGGHVAVWVCRRCGIGIVLRPDIRHS